MYLGQTYNFLVFLLLLGQKLNWIELEFWKKKLVLLKDFNETMLSSLSSQSSTHPKHALFWLENNHEKQLNFLEKKNSV